MSVVIYVDIDGELTPAEFTDDEWEDIKAIAEEYDVHPEALVNKVVRDKE